MSKETKKVLIVEDEQSLREVLQLKLREAGYDPSTANDGQEAIKALTTSKYDLVLLDILMPVMDGLATLEAMQKADIKVPTIMITNLGEGEEMRRAKKLGAIGYIVKSDTTLAEIIEKIKTMCKA